MIISFEGIHGCGKSTLIDKLYSKLCKSNNVYISQYNSYPPLEDVERYLRRNNKLVNSYTYFFMQLTDLASRYENIVKDKLENDYLVIFDRYIDTGIVRALARGMNSNFIYKSFSIFDKPDVSFLLDIPSDLACERKLPNTNQAWMIGMNQLEIPNTFDRDGYVHYQEKCRLLYLNQMNRNDCVILNGKLNTKHLYEIALKKIISLGAKG